MVQRFDVIVLGLGGMGSATVAHLTKQGRKVLGLEQFTPAHDRGSSHGKTRIIRQAYFENPAYVPLLLRAYELWRDLEDQCGERLLFETGGLMMGAESSAVIRGSLASAKGHGLPHEILSSSEITRRYPALSPPVNHIALYEQRAGYLLPERCTLAHLNWATRGGADVHFHEKVLSWQANDSHVTVRTSRGLYEADQLVITAGPWAPEILQDSKFPLAVERQVLYWFQSSLGVRPFSRLPVYIWEKDDVTMPYGFPATDGPKGGVKVAFHAAPITTQCNADAVDREVQPIEIATMQRAIRDLMPALDGECIQAVTCLYTNTPDGHFILSRHPQHERVCIACGFSGHGFKFASVMGEVLANLITQGSTNFDIGFLDPARFAVNQRL